MIKQRRVINIKKYLHNFKENDYIYISIKYDDLIKTKLLNIGFNKIEEGESILPYYKGKATITNSDGLEIIRKDLEKITYFQELPYELKDYQGHIHSGINYIPRLKYVRDLLDSMGIKLNIINKNGDLIIVSDPIINSVENEFKIKNTVNMFLEIFGEALILNEKLELFDSKKTIKYNFEFLKKGEYPWDIIKNNIISGIEKKYGNGVKEHIINRWNTIEKYDSDFIGIGLGGFKGYIVFGFIEKNTYILESVFLNNATYIFDENWKNIVNLTKAIILKGDLHQDRIIHGPNWENDINKILNP